VRAIACVVRRVRAAPVVSRGGTRAMSRRMDVRAAMVRIFSICPVFPVAVRVVVNSEPRAIMIVVIDSIVSGVAPFA